ncbi:hypothetical protein [Bremerella sp. P1]|uniref:hypothetical protein n=1 Tax=Bremerella sp. P1 TaxID=3026424 RepID=UPI002367C5FC|nr:hypothetical protein [Bremerella sp. P1]WDI42155.1 hypothetical protein PSR63_27260 [Bremerella sp. P1]
MATYNGIGTVRYDWQRRDDTTANATVWFVIFFLPIYPLRREHVRVHGSGIRKGTPMETIAAMFGFGQGFHSEIEVLGPTSNALWRIARTYLLGWIVVPLLGLMGPVLLFTVMINITQAIGYDMKSDGAWLPMITGILGLLWIGCLVAYILDRSAGRHHIYDPTKEPSSDS